MTNNPIGRYSGFRPNSKKRCSREGCPSPSPHSAYVCRWMTGGLQAFGGHSVVTV
jgi:hypothetical protein